MRFGTDKASVFWDGNCWAVSKAAGPKNKEKWLRPNWWYTDIANAAAKVVQLTEGAGGDVDGLWDAVAEMRRLQEQFKADVHALNIVPS